MLDDYHKWTLKQLLEKFKTGELLDLKAHRYVVVVGGAEMAYFSNLQGALTHSATTPRTKYRGGGRAQVYVLDIRTGETFDVREPPPGMELSRSSLRRKGLA